jgi:two-component system response regulator BaeR
MARVKAILRRTGGQLDKSGDQIEFDESGYRVLFHGHDLKLTAVEYHLFASLYRHKGRIFSRDQLINHIYKDHRIVNDRTVDSHIKKLRIKIARIKPGVELIHSVYGLGYKFDF